MNFALAVLEKKMRGRASPEEQWQVDQLLSHAMAMQDELHGPADKTQLSGPGTARGPAGGGARTTAEHMSEQLRAKEVQLRALEERVATAECESLFERHVCVCVCVCVCVWADAPQRHWHDCAARQQSTTLAIAVWRPTIEW